MLILRGCFNKSVNIQAKRQNYGLFLKFLKVVSVKLNVSPIVQPLSNSNICLGPQNSWAIISSLGPNLFLPSHLITFRNKKQSLLAKFVQYGGLSYSSLSNYLNFTISTTQVVKEHSLGQMQSFLLISFSSLIVCHKQNYCREFVE